MKLLWRKKALMLLGICFLNTWIVTAAIKIVNAVTVKSEIQAQAVYSSTGKSIVVANQTSVGPKNLTTKNRQESLSHVGATFELHYGQGRLLVQEYHQEESARGAREKITKAIDHFHTAITWSSKLSVSRRRMETAVLNDLAIALQKMNRNREAIHFLKRCLEKNHDDVAILGNLAMSYHAIRDEGNAIHYMKKALELQPNNSALHHNYGNILQAISKDEEAVVHWKAAIAANPNSIQSHCSLGIIAGDQNNVQESQAHFRNAITSAEKLIAKTNKEDYVTERDGAILQYVTAVLPRIYSSTEQIHEVRHRYRELLDRILQSDEPLRIKNPIITTGSGSMGYYLIYQGFNDLELRSKLAQVYLQSSPVLNFTAPHVHQYRNMSIQSSFIEYPQATLPERQIYRVERRLRVGFVSGFFYHHSVGLLIKNVILGLSRKKFEVILLSFSSISDVLTASLEESADKVVHLEHDIHDAQRQVSDEEIDILVYTEIGMHSYTYFLSFAQLGLRSIVFWGHAITSGIPTLDYFVTSKWFQPSTPSTEERYSECLYRMQGLTTSFPRPPGPDLTITRSSFDFPATGSMYLIPQTLYKIHPDFDRLINQILLQDKGGYLVLPIGAKMAYLEALRSRWSLTLDASVSRRIFIAPRMTSAQFLALCALADVVLDPFPVGGGRSSFEIFSVNTPIVLLYPRTSILQLTYAMYNKMGIYDCICYTEEQFVRVATRLATDYKYREEISKRIREQKHLLYDQDEVIEEWERMLIQVSSELPPQPSKGDTAKKCPNFVTKTRQPEPIFQCKLYLPQTKHSHELIAFAGEHPRQLTEQFALSIRDQLKLDNVQARFIERTLEKGIYRYREPIAGEFHLQLPLAETLIPFAIHVGDDLHLVGRYFREKYQLSSLQVNQLLLSLQKQFPEATSAAWIAHRVYHRTPALEGFHPGFDPSLSSAPRSCVTLAMTTCRRLDLFKRTVESLARIWETSYVCQVLIVDDNSSVEDRIQMLSMFPEFEFVFKDSNNKGHSVSMNMIMQMAKTRYLLYIEDDWEFTASNISFVLHQALSIFENGRSLDEPIGEVLLNNQFGGYFRHLPSLSIDYYVHEYAAMDPQHTFSYWPGFSLNPGIWDLDLLRYLNLTFDEENSLFERAFSLQYFHKGLKVAYLADVNSHHIGAPAGTNASAYVLNGLPRPFD